MFHFYTIFCTGFCSPNFSLPFFSAMFFAAQKTLEQSRRRHFHFTAAHISKVKKGKVGSEPKLLAATFSFPDLEEPSTQEERKNCCIVVFFFLEVTPLRKKTKEKARLHEKRQKHEILLVAFCFFSFPNNFVALLI